MIFKQGVRTLGVKPELTMALLVADQCYTNIDVNMVVTSVVDGRHSAASKHYLGLAADIRTRNLTSEQRVKMFETLKVQLHECLVLWEGKGTPNEHFHIQFNGAATRVDR